CACCSTTAWSLRLRRPATSEAFQDHGELLQWIPFFSICPARFQHEHLPGISSGEQSPLHKSLPLPISVVIVITNKFYYHPSYHHCHHCCYHRYQCILMKEPCHPSNPSNSETSERLLQVLAASPIATGILEDALNNNSMSDDNSWSILIPYEGLRSEFRLSDLHIDITESKTSWLSFMLYVGGLTFANHMPDKQLKIPNLVAAQRFARGILNRYQLRVSDIKGALQKLATGDISTLLGHYQRLMSIRDVGEDDLRKKSEENHRDSFYYALLMNPLLLDAHVEFEITKSSSRGRVDLLTKAKASEHPTVITEWKAARINFLDIQPADQLPGQERSDNFLKALTLSNISDASTVLQLKFAPWDKFGRAGKTIREWILEKDGPGDQLVKYWDSSEIVERRPNVLAYLVIIVGSRKILLWQLDKGEFLKEPLLVGEEKCC
ncbi:LOW QUALITY PROTEIN: hypothetical protein BC937DRAFT_86442, partial [Endogone sp. FLAS-F59071]